MKLGTSIAIYLTSKKLLLYCAHAQKLHMPVTLSLCVAVKDYEVGLFVERLDYTEFVAMGIHAAL